MQQGECLFKKGNSSKTFYFLLKGKIELIVEDPNNPTEFKFSKNVDEFDFFGLKSSGGNDIRNEYARVVTDKCFVIQIDRDNYENIVKKTQLSVSEQKIDFLLRYVPRLRAVGRNVIQELEVFFMKVVYTQGYLVSK